MRFAILPPNTVSRSCACAPAITPKPWNVAVRGEAGQKRILSYFKNVIGVAVEWGVPLILGDEWLGLSGQAEGRHLGPQRCHAALGVRLRPDTRGYSRRARCAAAVVLSRWLNVDIVGAAAVLVVGTSSGGVVQPEGLSRYGTLDSCRRRSMAFGYWAMVYVGTHYAGCRDSGRHNASCLGRRRDDLEPGARWHHAPRLYGLCAFWPMSVCWPLLADPFLATTWLSRLYRRVWGIEANNYCAGRKRWAGLAQHFYSWRAVGNPRQ